MYNDIHLFSFFFSFLKICSHCFYVQRNYVMIIAHGIKSKLAHSNCLRDLKYEQLGQSFVERYLSLTLMFEG